MDWEGNDKYIYVKVCFPFESSNQVNCVKLRRFQQEGEEMKQKDFISHCVIMWVLRGYFSLIHAVVFSSRIKCQMEVCASTVEWHINSAKTPKASVTQTHGGRWKLLITYTTYRWLWKWLLHSFLRINWKYIFLKYTSFSGWVIYSHLTAGGFTSPWWDYISWNRKVVRLL